MVFLAFCFHRSAFILLLLYPVYYLRLKKLVSLLPIGATIFVVFLFRAPIFSAIYVFFRDFYDYEISETGAYKIFLLLLVFVGFSFVISKNSELDDETVGLRNILCLCAVLQIFAGLSSLVMRFNYYFLLFVPIVIPRIMKYSSFKNRRIAYISEVVMNGFFTFYFFYNTVFGSDTLQLYPYSFFWQQM